MTQKMRRNHILNKIMRITLGHLCHDMEVCPLFMLMKKKKRKLCTFPCHEYDSLLSGSCMALDN